MSGIIISVRTKIEEVFVTKRNSSSTFYAIPGFVAILKAPVV